MNVKIKSINIRSFDRVVVDHGIKEKRDCSVMSYEEMQQMKINISDVLGITPMQVTVHFEGKE